MECSDWNVNYMTIFSLKKESVSSDVSDLELLVSRDTFPAEDPELQDMIDRLLVSAFKKSPDTGKSCSCKVWGFQQVPPGKEDETLLNTLLDAPSLPDFREDTTRLAGRYSGLAGCHPGLLVFLNVRITPAKGMGGTFLVMFALDFEELNRMDPHLNQVEIVTDGVNKKCNKAFIFPFFNGYELDRDKVKIINVGKAEGSIPDLLYITPPTDTDTLVMKELYKAVTERHDADQYESYFQAPNKGRELFGDDSCVAPDDMLSPDETAHICKSSFQKTLDIHGKKPTVKLEIGEGIKFNARVDKFNENFFFFADGEMKYLLVRGESIIDKGAISGIDFLDVPQCDREALEKLIGKSALTDGE